LAGYAYGGWEYGCLMAALFVTLWFLFLSAIDEVNNTSSDPDKGLQGVNTTEPQRYDVGKFNIQYIGIYPHVLGAQIQHLTEGWKVYVKFEDDRQETVVRDKYNRLLFVVEKIPAYNYGDFFYMIAKRVAKDERMKLFKELQENAETGAITLSPLVGEKKAFIEPLRPSSQK